MALSDFVVIASDLTGVDYSSFQADEPNETQTLRSTLSMQAKQRLSAAGTDKPILSIIEHAGLENGDDSLFEQQINFLIYLAESSDLTPEQINQLVTHVVSQKASISREDIENAAGYLWLYSMYGLDLVRTEVSGLISELAGDYLSQCSDSNLKQQDLESHLKLALVDLFFFDDGKKMECRPLKAPHNKQFPAFALHHLRSQMILESLLIKDVSIPEKRSYTQAIEAKPVSACDIRGNGIPLGTITQAEKKELPKKEYTSTSPSPLTFSQASLAEQQFESAVAEAATSKGYIRDQVNLVAGDEHHQLMQLNGFLFVVKENDNYRRLTLADLEWIETTELSFDNFLLLLSKSFEDLTKASELQLLINTLLKNNEKYTLPQKLSIARVVNHQIEKKWSEHQNKSDIIKLVQDLDSLQSLLQFRKTCLSIESAPPMIKGLLDNSIYIAYKNVTKRNEWQALSSDELSTLVSICLIKGETSQVIEMVEADQHESIKVEGLTILQWACKHGNLELAEMIYNKCNLNVAAQHTSNSETLLHLASKEGNASIVDWLLKLKVPLDVSCRKGKTPMSLAIENGHENVVEQLIKAHPKEAIRRTVCRSKELPLLQACRLKRTTLMSILIPATAAQSAINTADSTGYAAIHLATVNNDVNALGCLLENGANIDLQVNNKKINNNYTAIQLAVMNGNEECFFLLWRRCAERFDLQGPDLLHLAVKGGNQKIVKELIESGDFELNASKRDRGLGLHYIAIEEGNLEMLKFLTQYQEVLHSMNYTLVSVKSREHCLNYAYLQCSQSNRVAIMEFLLKIVGLNRDCTFRSSVIDRMSYVTPLMLAVYKYDVDVVRLLKKHGCSLRALCKTECCSRTARTDSLRHDTQYTALELARSLGYQELVEILSSS